MSSSLWDPASWWPVLSEVARRALHHPQRFHPIQKPDGSWVTPADEEADEFLGTWASRQGWDYLGEESARGWRAMPTRRPLLIVDPIDGTGPFCSGLETWGISLGLVLHERFTEGLLFLPELNTLLWSQGREVLVFRGEWNHAEPQALIDHGQRIQAPVEVRPQSLIAISQSVAKKGRVHSPRGVHATGCSVYALGHLILGHYAAFVSPGYVWDFAGAIPLLRRTGMSLKYRGRTVENYDLFPGLFGEREDLLAPYPLIWAPSPHGAEELESIVEQGEVPR